MKKTIVILSILTSSCTSNMMSPSTNKSVDYGLAIGGKPVIARPAKPALDYSPLLEELIINTPEAPKNSIQLDTNPCGSTPCTVYTCPAPFVPVLRNVVTCELPSVPTTCPVGSHVVLREKLMCEID